MLQIYCGEPYILPMAAGALGHIGPAAKDAVPALTALLRDKDWGARFAAARALGGIGPPASNAVPALTQLLKDKDEDVRKAAAEALEKIKKKPAP